MLITIKRWLWNQIIKVRFLYLAKLQGMDLHKSAKIALKANLDGTNPGGVHIDEESYCAAGAIVFSHDFTRGLHADTYIGKRCFIGANAIIMPGLRVGDNVIVGAGAVVTKDVPNGCIVAGNPARVIREGIRTGRYGKLLQ